MKRYIIFSILVSLVCLIGEAKTLTKKGSKPEWVSKGESVVNDKRSNQSYYFKAINLSGDDLNTIAKDRVNALSTYIGQTNNISGNAERTVEQTYGSNGREGKDSFVIKYTNDINVDTFYAKLVDDYWEYVEYPNGQKGYEYYALFAVSRDGKQPQFDDYEVTTSYGAAPVAMSIIPGAGQWYKGSKGKAVGFFLADAAAVAGIIVCDNQRASYVKKAKEQPKFAKEYSDKASNWETGRNICIGVAAGIWAWNILDAAIAKGAPRIIVKPGSGRGLSMTPVIMPEYTGVTLAYTF